MMPSSGQHVTAPHMMPPGGGEEEDPTVLSGGRILSHSDIDVDNNVSNCDISDKTSNPHDTRDINQMHTESGELFKPQHS